MPEFSLLALCYGPHPDLARRCLGSIQRAVRAGTSPWALQDVRIGLNACCDRTRNYVTEWAREMGRTSPVTLYVTDTNAFKYPLMRRMLRDADSPRPLGEWVMWFDDDSYLDPVGADWWAALSKAACDADMVGQLWKMPVQGNQLEWVKRQPWCNPRAGVPPYQHRSRPCFQFCQGAWWLARSRMLMDLDWPVPELKHNGGDSMLGEAMRHKGCRMVRFDKGLHINADAYGRHSKARPRRKHDNRVGWDYAPGRPPDVSHQHFQFTRFCFGVLSDHDDRGP